MLQANVVTTRLPGAHRRTLIIGVVQSSPIFLTSFLLTISILLIFLSFTFFLDIVSILSFGPQSLGHFYPTVLLIFQVSFFLIFMVYIYLFNGSRGAMTHMEVKGQLAGTGSLLLPKGLQGLNTDVRLGSSCLSLLSHLASPKSVLNVTSPKEVS